MNNYHQKKTALLAFIKDTLKLLKTEYELLNNPNYELKHAQSLWKLFNKLYIQKEGAWLKVPKELDHTYLQALNDNQIKYIKIYVNENKKENLFWEFLLEWQKFMQQKLTPTYYGIKRVNELHMRDDFQMHLGLNVTFKDDNENKDDIKDNNDDNNDNNNNNSNNNVANLAEDEVFEKFLESFPKDIMIAHAGSAYLVAVKEFQPQSEREQT